MSKGVSLCKAGAFADRRYLGKLTAGNQETP
jgi:hypothetical protein